MMRASYEGHTDIVQMLIKTRAEINAQDKVRFVLQ